MNLICPAWLILLPVGAEVAPAGERIARVYASPDVAEDAERLGLDLAVGVGVVPELRQAPGESGSDAVRRCEAALSGIADLHRGETVVVIAPGLSLGIELGTGPVKLEHDGFGWTVVPDPKRSGDAR